MSVAIITGSAGLVGSEAAIYFARLGLEVVGLDNDMRAEFFGEGASTRWNRKRIQSLLRRRYSHLDVDIRERERVDGVFRRNKGSIALVIHAAAQPSHDWAARSPQTDFDINAVGTLNLLEAARRHAPEAPFVFTSTNKVYGDLPNSLPLVEEESRWELSPDHRYRDGIGEGMSIDQSLHSLFGASKVAADVLVQEYGRYFGMRTACFRGGTLTGPAHSATELHGFLAYIMRCAMTRTPYTVFGYKGKQVRDAIHSADLVRAFHRFFEEPRSAAVYNIGGGRFSNASVIEAIGISEEISGEELQWRYEPRSRTGDHIWWIGSNARFEADFPGWTLEYDVRRLLLEIFEGNAERWKPRARPGGRGAVR